ncbi:MAG: nucleotide exchange factor GrpE [Gammaproteobacteria bacterium]|nr:MAG: nucleotide exchange factor GrpE [Gammaproteobacteria bacterium]
MSAEEQQDENPQAGDSAPASTGTPEVLEEIGLDDTDADKAEISKLQEQANQDREQILRLRAELDNLHKRNRRELENAHKFAMERFINELLPVVDSLEMGLDAADGEDVQVEQLREGNELTLKMCVSVLEKFGVTMIDPLGEPFDPKLHEAMATQPAENADPNIVLTVVQKGYELNGRLVRPARVIVSANPGS